MDESDPLATVDVESFFAGVDEMRAYLERNLHDPVRRRARLQQIAKDLLKPRSARCLAAWLGQAVRQAVGAGGCAVWVRERHWLLFHRSGTTDAGPSPEALDALSGPQLQGELPAGLLVPVQGIEGMTAALWLQDAEPLDADSRGLLAAIAGTAGMVLAQGLRVEALTRDPISGLLSAASFIDHAGTELRQPAGSGMLFALMAVRLLGAEGLDRLGGAARRIFAPGTPLTRRGKGRTLEQTDDLFAVPSVVTLLTGEREIHGLARAVAARAGDQPWAAAFAFVPEPIDDLTSAMERLSTALDDLQAGQVLRVSLA